jgi:hypothetical protein
MDGLEVQHIRQAGFCSDLMLTARARVDIIRGAGSRDDPSCPSACETSCEIKAMRAPAGQASPRVDHRQPDRLVSHVTRGETAALGTQLEILKMLVETRKSRWSAAALDVIWGLEVPGDPHRHNHRQPAAQSTRQTSAAHRHGPQHRLQVRALTRILTAKRAASAKSSQPHSAFVLHR